VLGGEQVEGRQAVRELLAAGLREVSEVWMTEGNDPSPILGEIDHLAREAHVPVRLVSPRRLESVQGTETPQGVVAFAEALTVYTIEQLVLGDASDLNIASDIHDIHDLGDEGDEGDEENEGGNASSTSASGQAGSRGLGSRAGGFLVVLDGVTDPQNLGAILRTAECAGATGALIPRHRAVHVTPAVTKAAAGAVEHLRMSLVAGVPAALQELERLGVMTVGLDGRGSTSIFDLKLGDRPVALVLGSEGSGLAPLVRQRCDVLANIPLSGTIPSLNVSAAAAIACFEVARQRSGS
jgi:23S rRNA (guanosine2251-2'-O)-methyltransferase